MDHIAMIEKVREEMLQEVNQRCDDLIRRYQEEEQGISPKIEIRERTLAWSSPAALKGKYPVALTFASGEVVLTPTWKKVVQTILKHCNEQPDMHEKEAWADVLGAKVVRVFQGYSGLQMELSGVKASRLDAFSAMLAGYCSVEDYENWVNEPEEEAMAPVIQEG